MKTEICEVIIPLCVPASELAGLLEESEFLGAWEQEGTVRLYWKGRGDEVLSKVHLGIRQLGVVLEASAIGLRPVPEEDWNAKWATSAKPVRVGRRIVIRPSWASVEVPDDAVELVLDPRQAFGTGHHVTTQLLLEWLEQVEWSSGHRVLDVGTGSGILSMAALRLGAREALGIDNDETAIVCARDYAIQNGFGDEFTLRCCRLEDVGSSHFSVILANVDRRTLLGLRQDFRRFCAEDTRLFLSGLLEEDEEDLLAHFQQAGWQHYRIKRRDGWIALQFSPSSEFVGKSWRDSK